MNTDISGLEGNQKKYQIVLTGGHHTSALAVIDALTTSGLPYQFYFVGHRHSMHGETSDSVEYRDVATREIPFYDLKAGKLYRTYDIVEWLRVPWGFFQALAILIKIRPSIIISFGGYLAVPVVLAAWLLGIPAVTHEQTVTSGWANRLIARFVRQVYISWPESAKFFPRKKVVLTGLPLRKEIAALAKELAKTSSELPSKKSRPTIYVTGGKQGSRVINEALRGCLKELLADFEIIHACGVIDHQDFLKIEDGLSQELKAHYVVKDYFSESEIAEVFRVADLVVGRAGAHTVYELAALGKPAIFIPIPWVSHHEQQKNAEVLAALGLAKILPQNQLNSPALLKSCREVVSQLSQLGGPENRARQMVDLKAAEKIATEISRLLVG